MNLNKTNENISLSIITISYNNFDGLKLTMDSILKQTYKNYEYIVIDGGSEDGSKELLKTYKKLFDRSSINMQYISEKDKGIYNAMNKGIDIATKEWIIFMNSGDIFADANVLFQVFRNNEIKNYDVIYGDFYFKNAKGKLIPRKSNEIYKINKALITCHQAIFTKTALLQKRKFKEKYKIIADYEWYLNAYQEEKKFYYIPKYICIFDGSGISSNNDYKVFCECMDIRKEHGVLRNAKIIVKIKKMIMYIFTILKKLFKVK